MDAKHFKLFCRFLKEENAFYPFIRNYIQDGKRYETNNQPIPLLDLTTAVGYDMIKAAFFWSNTKEGGFFWLCMSDKWNYKVKKLTKLE